MPRINLAGSSIGKNRTIALDVVDERCQILAGHRAVEILPSGEIVLNEKFIDGLCPAIVLGLQAHGFVPQGFDVSSPRSLLVQVKVIDYEVLVAILGSRIQTRVWLKAVCQNGDKTFQKYYRQEDVRWVLVPPNAERNAQQINETVSAVLQGMLDDRALLDFLST